MIKGLSIRVQMVLIICFTSVVTLLMSVSFLMVYDLSSLRGSIQRDMKVQAGIIADSASAAVAFDDKEAAETVLQTLKSKPEIEAAVVYKKNREPLAVFSKDKRSAEALVRQQLSAPNPRLLLSAQTITEDSGAGGEVMILSSLAGIETRKGMYGIAIAGMALLALLTSMAIGSYMQNLITKPLLQVSGAMKLVTNTKDYSQRLEVPSTNEVGALVGCFNQMLIEIEESSQKMQEEVQARLLREAELEVSRAQLADFFEKAPLGLFRVDADAVVQQVNSAASAMLGYEPHELMGSNLSAYTESPSALSEALARLKTSGDFEGDDLVFLCRNGAKKIVEISANAQFSGREQIGARIFTKDVTLLRQAEADHKAMVLAERANQAKTEFLSRMSHELRTPLNAILGFGQLLEMGDLSLEDKECVDHILKGGRHLLNLINEVLNISKIEAGDLTISMEAVCLAEVISETIDLVTPLAVSRGINIENATHHYDDVFARGDRQRLSQILINLLSNAVKYNKDGGSVLIAMDRLDGKVKLRVADTGSGIQDHLVSRLFVPFDRLGAEQTQIEGSGLGLAYSKALTEAQGGRLYLDQGFTGPGACFVLELSEALEATVIPTDSNTVSLYRTRTKSSDHKTVLVIEDNEANIRLYQHIFTARSKAKLLIAAQGEIGLQLAESQRPDLILLDANLPDIHGSEVAKRLRQNPLCQQMPIIVVSADATEPTKKLFGDYNIMAYITKPVNVRGLLEVVDSCLEEEVKQVA